MRIIFHCISSENPLATDKVADEQTERMVRAIVKQIEKPYTTEIKKHQLFGADQTVKTALTDELKANQPDVYHVLIPYGRNNQDQTFAIIKSIPKDSPPQSYPVNMLWVYKADWLMFPLDHLKPELRIPSHNLFNITDKETNIVTSMQRDITDITGMEVHLAMLLLMPDPPEGNFYQYQKLQQDIKSKFAGPTVDETESMKSDNRNEWAKAAIELPAVIMARVEAYENSLRAVSSSSITVKQ